MLVFALLLVQTAAPSVRTPPTTYTPVRVDDAEACDRLKIAVTLIQRDLPVQTDAVTRTNGMAVLCSARSVTVNKFIDADLASFRKGWEARKQRQWDEVICRNEGYAPLAKRGWRFSHVLTFRSGERITQDADCS